MRYLCPKCGKEFEGKPNFCPHCGAKLNWPKEEAPQQAPAARPAQQQAPRPQSPQRQAAPQPRPKIRQVDDDAPIYGQTTVRRKRKAPTYALPIKVLMISFSGLVGLFSLVLLLTFLGDFLNIKGGGLGESGYSLAFDFDHSKIGRAHV